MFATKRFILDETFEDLEDSQHWLESKGHPTFEKVPGQLVQFRGLGCKTINWSGSKVGLICFENSKEETVHLFVVDASTFAELSPIDHVAVHRGLETGGWRDQDKVFLLVGSAPDVSVAELL